MADDPRGPDQSGGAHVCVLAPSPLLTVTVESSPGDGSDDLHLHAGGQGFWVARMVQRLGARTQLVGAFCGERGLVARVLVEAEGIELRAVRAAGANGAYVHDRRGGERRTVAETPAEPLTRHELDDLRGATIAAALDAGVCVLTGAQPADLVPAALYRSLAADLTRAGVPVVADLSGAPLREALAGWVRLLKVSRSEVIDAGYAESEDREELITAIGRFREDGAENVLLSCGADPSLADVGDVLYEVAAPDLVAVDTAGSGDSMTAAFAYALAAGLGPEDGLRLAAAAGALNVTRHGLGSGRRTDIEQLARHVELTVIDGDTSRGAGGR